MNYFFLILIFVLAGCAQIVPPSGGPKDTLPPRMMEENTVPQNKTVNFNSKTIVITFDEYIRLNNPGENIIISPAMAEKPEYVLKGKKLFIRLKSDLKPHTTYTINFGNCITDITENNPAAGLTYVFSTGTSLDSLSVHGQVTNAFTNVPEKGVWVLLHHYSGAEYNDTSDKKNWIPTIRVGVPKYSDDSLLITRFPDYLAKTDNSGMYSLQNLAPGKYKVYALKDGNSDYKYSQPIEEIAFLNNSIVVKENLNSVNLKMFSEKSEAFFVSRASFSHPGMVSIILKNDTPVGIDIKPLNLDKDEIIHWDFSDNSDTVTFWVKPKNIKSELLFYVSGGKFEDTISILIPEKKKESDLLPIKNNLSKNFGLLDSIVLKTDYFVSVLENKILLYENDTVQISPDIRMEMPENEFVARRISLHYAWKENTNYKLILNEGALTDDYGRHSKNDTLKFSTAKKSYYGKIISKIDTPKGNYIIQIANQSDKMVFEKSFSGVANFDVENIPPGSYKMKIIEDKDRDGKWSTGILNEKKQPEQVWHYKEPIVIRSNWDFELTWKIEN